VQTPAQGNWSLAGSCAGPQVPASVVSVGQVREVDVKEVSDEDEERRHAAEEE